MAEWGSILRRAAVSGAVASLTSTAALAAAAASEGRPVAAPLNATSHWRHGDRAATLARADLAHTGTGYATHLAATIFWAVLFEWWIARRGRRGRAIPLDAAAVSAIAAAVDYTVTPARFTPGWELVLGRRSMAAGYAAMAAGLAATALLRAPDRRGTGSPTRPA